MYVYIIFLTCSYDLFCLFVMIVDDMYTPILLFLNSYLFETEACLFRQCERFYCMLSFHFVLFIKHYNIAHGNTTVFH